MAFPKSNATEEISTFLTANEWGLLEGEVAEPYRSFFTFLVPTGLRFGEVTALEAMDFVTTSTGQHVVNIVRAWTKDENNVPYIGPPKTKQSKRSVALTPSTVSDIRPLMSAAAKAGGHVLFSTTGRHIDHRRAWGVWDLAVMKAQTKGLTKRGGDRSGTAGEKTTGTGTEALFHMAGADSRRQTEDRHPAVRKVFQTGFSPHC